MPPQWTSRSAVWRGAVCSFLRSAAQPNSELLVAHARQRWIEEALADYRLPSSVAPSPYANPHTADSALTAHGEVPVPATDQQHPPRVICYGSIASATSFTGGDVDFAVAFKTTEEDGAPFADLPRAAHAAVLESLHDRMKPSLLSATATNSTPTTDDGKDSSRTTTADASMSMAESTETAMPSMRSLPHPYRTTLQRITGARIPILRVGLLPAVCPGTAPLPDGPSRSMHHRQQLLYWGATGPGAVVAYDRGLWLRPLQHRRQYEGAKRLHDRIVEQSISPPGETVNAASEPAKEAPTAKPTPVMDEASARLAASLTAASKVGSGIGNGAPRPLPGVYRPLSEWDCAVSLTGCRNSALLRHYFTRYPTLRYCAMLLKHWGKRKVSIVDARGGWLSPYALSVMLIHFAAAEGYITLDDETAIAAAGVNILAENPMRDVPLEELARMAPAEMEAHAACVSPLYVPLEWGTAVAADAPAPLVAATAALCGVPSSREEDDGKSEYSLSLEEALSGFYDLGHVGTCPALGCVLKAEPKKLHDTSVEHVLQRFFAYYADFDYEEAVIDVRSVGRIHTKDEWHQRIKADFLAETDASGHEASAAPNNTNSINGNAKAESPAESRTVGAATTETDELRLSSPVAAVAAPVSKEGTNDSGAKAAAVGLSAEQKQLGRRTWLLLGYDVMAIRDPYEPHSLGRGVEFFRAEAIREEFRRIATSDVDPAKLFASPLQDALKTAAASPSTAAAPTATAPLK